MKIDVLNKEGKKTGRSIELREDVFGIEPNEHVVYLAVKSYLANQRQGTHKAKERGEIKGSTRKIKKQKGTGTARAGSIKNPLFRSGGRIFGPKPRIYEVKLNKKVKKLARKSVLSSMLKEGKLVVIEDFSFDQPKTKDAVSLLANFDALNNKSLVVTASFDDNVYRSIRNIKNVKLSRAQDINPYEMLNAKKMIVAESAIEQIQNMF